VFIWKNRIEAKTSSDTLSGILVQLRRESEFDWRFLRRKSPEVNFCEASLRPGGRVRPRTCAQRFVAPVRRLLKKCFCVSSFHFTGPELRQAHRCACAASIEHVFVFRCFRLPDSELWPACQDPQESALSELVQLG